MLFVRKNFMVWRRLLRTLAAFFRLRTMLGFSKKRRRRTSLRMRSPCTTLLNRFKADSNDSLSSTTTRVKKLTPLWFVICELHYNRRDRRLSNTRCNADSNLANCDGRFPVDLPHGHVDAIERLVDVLHRVGVRQAQEAFAVWPNAVPASVATLASASR